MCCQNVCHWNMSPLIVATSRSIESVVDSGGGSIGLQKWAQWQACLKTFYNAEGSHMTTFLPSQSKKKNNQRWMQHFIVLFKCLFAIPVFFLIWIYNTNGPLLGSTVRRTSYNCSQWMEKSAYYGEDSEKTTIKNSARFLALNSLTMKAQLWSTVMRRRSIVATHRANSWPQSAPKMC